MTVVLPTLFAAGLVLLLTFVYGILFDWVIKTYPLRRTSIVVCTFAVSLMLLLTAFVLAAAA